MLTSIKYQLIGQKKIGVVSIKITGIDTDYQCFPAHSVVLSIGDCVYEFG